MVSVDCYNTKTQNTISCLFCSEISKFIHLFIHSFFQYMLTEHLLCFRTCARFWGEKDE